MWSSRGYVTGQPLTTEISEQGNPIGTPNLSCYPPSTVISGLLKRFRRNLAAGIRTKSIWWRYFIRWSSGDFHNYSLIERQSEITDSRSYLKRKCIVFRGMMNIHRFNSWCNCKHDGRVNQRTTSSSSCWQIQSQHKSSISWKPFGSACQLSAISATISNKLSEW